MPKIYLKSMALKVAASFLEAGTSISTLLSQRMQKNPEEVKKAEEDLTNDLYQKRLISVPEKNQSLIKAFLTWQIIKNKSNLDDFLRSHPDFLTDKRTIAPDIQKLFGKLKDSGTTLDQIEQELYPEISKFKDSDVKKSDNPHFKELDVPGMPSGQKWVLITDKSGEPISECRGEAKAMGHCGLSTGGELLSLRDAQGRSHLTVDRTSNKQLLQLKAGGNRVIRDHFSKFRPYIGAIKALLLSDEIATVEDHEMSDISVLDLLSEHDQGLLDDIRKKKPGLITTREKEILFPIYEKHWKGELSVEDLLARLK